MERGNRKRIVAYAWLALLLLCGAAVRIAGCWWQRHTHNPDFGIVALMAKHMAEGRDFPVFFYGQPYMGSLEPMVSAILCRVMGFSGFAVCLGTALVGFLLLPLLFRVGRESGGVAAGLVAVAYCVVGPGGYFHYQVSSRGGYPLTLLLATTVLWMSVNIIFRERNGFAVSGWRWFLLGLAAGAGWWTNQLIGPAIAAAGLLFVIVLGRRVFTWKIAPGLAGFLTGSLPLWIWNARNGWGTFDFLDSLGGTQPGRGLELFIKVRLPAILDFGGGPAGSRVMIGLVLVAAFVIVVIRFAISLRKNGVSRANLHMMAMLLYVGVLAVSFCSSHYAKLNTPRYLMPVVPVIALFLGIAVARYPKTMFLTTAIVLVCAGAMLMKNLPLGGEEQKTIAFAVPVALAAWFGMLLLVRTRATRWKTAGALSVICIAALQVDNLRGLRMRGHAYDEWFANCEADFLQDLRRTGTKAIYTVFEDHAFNYALKEEFCFSDFKGERYAPYADFVEEQDSVAILNNYGRLDLLTASAGGTCEYSGNNRPYICYNIRPPEIGGEEIPPSEWAAVTAYAEKETATNVCDRNAGTRWRAHSPAGQDGLKWIEIRFKKPEVVSKIRITSDRNRYPNIWQVDGRKEVTAGWQELTKEMTQIGYYWSGPRCYFGGMMYRQECVCERVPVTSLRIRVSRDATQGDVEISELQIFRQADFGGAETNEVAPLIQAANKAGLTYLYCDRWIGNAVRKATAGSIGTPRTAEIHRMRRLESDMSVALNEETGILVRTEDAGISRDALAACGIAPAERRVGPWILFTFDKANLAAAHSESVLTWVGYGCLVQSPKRLANSLVLRSDELLARNDRQKALIVCKEAAGICPIFVPALERLADWSRRDGDTLAAEEYDSRLKHLRSGKNSPMASFGRRIKLMDVEASSNQVSRGDSFEARFFWKISPSIDLQNLIVFVHFRQNKRIGFQGDHALVDDVEDIDYQPVEEVFTGRKTINVPSNATPGVYEMMVGVYDPVRGNSRMSVRSDLPARFDAVTLPLKISVTP